MFEVDVLVIGSGVAALTILRIARECGRKAVAVDHSYSDGGYIQVLDHHYAVSKSPIFLQVREVDYLQSLGVDVKCLDVRTVVLKKGNYLAKTLGFTDIDVQRNWFYEWINSEKLCLCKNLFHEIKKGLGFEEEKPIHIPSNVRRIDLEKKVIALNIGEIIKFKQLVYTWPLPKLPYIIYPENLKKTIDNSVSSLNLQSIPSYILTTVLKKDRDLENIEIYIHSTKASKFHTAITFNTNDSRVLYTITSYSKEYPLLAGINEKLLSEIRKFKLAPLNSIVKEYGLNIAYALINRVDHKKIQELTQKLREYNVYLFGRLGLWKDQSVVEIIQNSEVSQDICS